jgi:hypothetical protein
LQDFELEGRAGEVGADFAVVEHDLEEGPAIERLPDQAGGGDGGGNEQALAALPGAQDGAGRGEEQAGQEADEPDVDAVFGLHGEAGGQAGPEQGAPVVQDDGPGEEVGCRGPGQRLEGRGGENAGQGGEGG